MSPPPVVVVGERFSARQSLRTFQLIKWPRSSSSGVATCLAARRHRPAINGLLWRYDVGGDKGVSSVGLHRRSCTLFYHLTIKRSIPFVVVAIDRSEQKNERGDLFVCFFSLLSPTLICLKADIFKKMVCLSVCLYM